MKRNYIGLVIFIIILIAILVAFFPKSVGASDGLPPDLYEWVREDGAICSAIVSVRGVALDCDCPCFSPECTVSANVETQSFSETPDDPVNTPEPTKEPTNEPKPTKTEKPPKTEKPKCNAGRGNGSEGNPDCDPGNSGKNNGGD